MLKSKLSLSRHFEYANKQITYHFWLCPEKDTKTNSVITDELSGPAVYILTGILPIEAQIHIKALTFFNNVCHQGDKNTEKKLEDN